MVEGRRSSGRRSALAVSGSQLSVDTTGTWRNTERVPEVVDIVAPETVIVLLAVSTAVMLRFEVTAVEATAGAHVARPPM